MTLRVCDQVAERVALGEPIGELSEHVEGCTGCKKLIATSSKLGATRHAVDPGLGFTARMTVGAQHRIAARRRQRLAVGLAATVVSGAFGVFLVTRPAEPLQQQALEIPTKLPSPTLESDEEEQPVASDDDDDLALLVQLGDVERNSQLSADWRHITRPLAPYKRLVKEVETP